MTNTDHLTEEERQGAADGTLDAARLHDAERHMLTCAACARDVATLRMLMARVPTSSPSGNLDDLWPSIRSRIDASKIVPLDATPIVTTPLVARRRSVLWIAGALVAALAVIVVSLPPMQASRNPTGPGTPTDAGSDFVNVSDSTTAYEAEANALLNQLELQRAMLPPDARSSVDHDLRIIDDAIAEVKSALVRDPNNPALRRLLASSYRQKVELLKRANGAS